MWCIILCSLLLVPQFATDGEPQVPGSTARLLDVTGDGLLDRLSFAPDGAVSVAVNSGARTFTPRGAGRRGAGSSARPEGGPPIPG